MRTQRFLLSPDAGEGHGGPAPEAKPAGKPDDAMATLVRENAELKGENFDYRKKNRSLTAQLATAKESGSVPADVTAELASYRALGKPDDLKGLSAFKAGVDRERSLTAIAKEAGYKPEAFLKVAGDAEFEVKAERIDGKDVKVVTVKGGDGKPVPIDDHFADLLPALKPDAESQKATGPKGTPRRGQATATHDDRPDNRSRQLDPENPHDIGLMLKASGLGAF